RSAHGAVIQRPPALRRCPAWCATARLGYTRRASMDARRRRRLAMLATFAVAGCALVVLGVASAAAASTTRAYAQKRYLRVAAGSSVSVAFRRPNVAGNLIVAFVVWDNGGGVSLGDSAGNAYQNVGGPTPLPDGSHTTQVFYAANVAGGPNTVTATFAS